MTTTPQLAIEQTLHRAVAEHQAGQLQVAEALYRGVLQFNPNHPEANHNMGALMVQMNRPAAGLPYFLAALDADPACGQYWLGYIDALFQAGLLEDARQVLALARQQGLEGDEADALVLRLDSGAQIANQSGTKDQQAAQESLPVSSANSQPDVKTRSSKPEQSVKKPAPHKGKEPSQQEINALVSLFSGGKYAEAVDLAQAMTEHFPLHGFGWSVLGLLFQQMGQHADALVLMQKAAALSPNDAQAHSNLGNMLSDLGRLDEALLSFRRALEINANFAGAHVNLGATLNDLGRLNEAEASYLKALKIDPSLAQAHYNLGNTLKNMGRLVEAEASFRQALKVKPDYAEAHSNLGIILQELGRLDESEASLRHALRIKPDYAKAHSNLGRTLQDMGLLEEAVKSYTRALQINPDYAQVHSNLGGALLDLGRLEDARASYLRALEIEPDYAEAHSNLGIALQEMGKLFEAEASYHRALKINPDYTRARSNLLFLLNYTSSHTPAYCLAQARQYGQAMVNKITSRFTEWSCAKQPERLRIGFVSGDFRNHPVGYFLEGLLTRLDPTSVELIAYPTNCRTDELTTRIKPHFADWIPLFGLSDEAAARQIQGDDIHVLVDLSGHTRYNRLPIFSWKPAPVQVSWLGYFATTGVPEIDYLLGDRYVAPTDDSGHFTEKLWQLPESYLCFTEPDVNLDVSPLPALSTGGITFGCFNNLTKMNDAVVAVWAKILTSVPESKLLLKTRQLNEVRVREATLQRFASHGIAAERLILENASPRAELLASYHRVDIALDTFPYPGGTTSIEGLWMGVPVITKCGDRFLSHVSETIAHNAGLSGWVAIDEDDYVAKAVSYATDLDRLAILRAGLRQRVLASPLFDATRFARHFEEAMWGMWQICQQKRGQS